MDVLPQRAVFKMKKTRTKYFLKYFIWPMEQLSYTYTHLQFTWFSNTVKSYNKQLLYETRE